MWYKSVLEISFKVYHPLELHHNIRIVFKFHSDFLVYTNTVQGRPCKFSNQILILLAQHLLFKFVSLNVLSIFLNLKFFFLFLICWKIKIINKIARIFFVKTFCKINFFLVKYFWGLCTNNNNNNIFSEVEISA